MAGAKIGLVLRTIRPTTAERTIRQVMDDFLSAEGIDYEPVDPEGLDPSRYRQLLFAPADPIDPLAIMPGPHILSAASIGSGTESSALAEYRYVSVRSSNDLSRMDRKTPKAAIVPCVTTRLAEKASPRSRRNAVGIHLDAVSFAAGQGWHEPLRELDGLEKVYIPFEPDSGDRGILAGLMWAVGRGHSVGSRTPGELFEIIGGLRLFVCSSLHAALFAYLQNVPFLLFPKSTHETDYLRDRGLDAWTFTSPGELRRKIALLLASAPDYRTLVERDRALVNLHFETLREALRSAAPVTVPDDLADARTRQPGYRFSGSLPETGVPVDPHRDENVRTFVSRLEDMLNRLHREIASQRDRIDELARGVDHFHSEFLRRENLLDEIRASRAWRLASRLQDLAARVRGWVGRSPGGTAR